MRSFLLSACINTIKGMDTRTSSKSLSQQGKDDRRFLLHAKSLTNETSHERETLERHEGTLHVGSAVESCNRKNVTIGNHLPHIKADSHDAGSKMADSLLF